MHDEDIRWIQRFNNLNKAFAQLKAGVELAEQRPLTNMEEQGLINIKLDALKRETEAYEA